MFANVLIRRNHLQGKPFLAVFTAGTCISSLFSEFLCKGAAVSVNHFRKSLADCADI